MSFLDNTPWEIHEETVYEVFDPGYAAIIGHFTTRSAAEACVNAHNDEIRARLDEERLEDIRQQVFGYQEHPDDVAWAKDLIQKILSANEN